MDLVENKFFCSEGRFETIETLFDELNFTAVYNLIYYTERYGLSGKVSGKNKPFKKLGKQDFASKRELTGFSLRI